MTSTPAAGRDMEPEGYHPIRHPNARTYIDIKLIFRVLKVAYQFLTLIGH